MNAFLLIAERARKRIIRLAGGKTVGVRVLVVNDRGETLLVRHTYRTGWHLPGGGVDAGESPEEAVVREVREEANVIVDGRPRLFAAYLHSYQGVDDYPLLYVVERFCIRGSERCAEIAEVGWFALDKLPAATTSATKHRIAEYLGRVEPTLHWTPKSEPAIQSGH